MARKTVFDDVFRTICQKMPYLLIPVINEVFKTDYPEDVQITQLRNEHFERRGEIITDSLIGIQDCRYHIECQSCDDNLMVIRMVEYDFAIALDHFEKEDNTTFRMDFPRSCVIYLRKSDSASRKSIVNIHFPDGTIVPYKMNQLCIQDYTEDELFKKKLLMFLPFYILRYENQLPSGRIKDAPVLNALLEEYQGIFSKLEASCGSEKDGVYTDLYTLIKKIINHVIKSKAVKRRFDDMGGRVLTLQSEKLKAEGIKEGMSKGIAKGYEKGQNNLVEAIQALKKGQTVDDLLKKGYDQKTINLALSCK